MLQNTQWVCVKIYIITVNLQNTMNEGTNDAKAIIRKN